MSAIEYGSIYNEYWGRADRWGSHSFTDSNLLADQILSVCGGGSFLDVGCGMGGLVLTLLRRGVDVIGVDVAPRPIEHLNQIAPDRFQVGTILKLPFQDGAFDSLICTDVLEHLDERDVAPAIAELYRVARGAVFLTIATAPDRDNRWHLCIHDRAWWEDRFFEAGFRKHPRGHIVLPYEAREKQDSPITVLVEKIPAGAVARYPLEALKAERDLHMDMLRETGRRSDAHEARYYQACPYVRPGDVVLDVACGLGYGAHILRSCTPLARVIGVDSSPYAADYARTCYGGADAEFHCADAGKLDFLPDQSVDYIVSMETLEHLASPEAFLADSRRVLKPGGRIMLSIPNEWLDESGRDPNPFHLHVYNWPKLRAQLEQYFIVERAYAQTAGGSIKLGDRPRTLREVSLGLAAETEAEWWLALCMKDPVGCAKTGYRETSFPDHRAKPEYNITAFERDYDNPWLVKGMISIGMRVVNSPALEQMATRVLASSRPESADAGAALCILGYRLLEARDLDAHKVHQFLRQAASYHDKADPSANAWRWRISIWYVAGLLQLAIGRAEDAQATFHKCAKLDCLKFSPLLATKTVDALFRAGLIAAARGELDDAKASWQAALEEARRVLSGSWVNIWGDPKQIVEFGLPEATQVLDLATRCAYGLVALRYWPTRPGYAWGQAFRNSARELQNLQRLLAEQQRANSPAIAPDVQAAAALERLSLARDQEWARVLEQKKELGERLQEAQTSAAELWHLLRQERSKGAAAFERSLQLRREAGEWHRHFDALYAWNQTLEAAHGARCNDLLYYRSRLEGIERSTGWRLLQIAYKLRFRIFPTGSERERFGRWCTHQYRIWRDRRRRRTLPAREAAAGPLEAATCTPAWVPSEPPAAAPDRKVPRDVAFAGEEPGLVSVVLPVYNQATLLADSIESVLAQTYRNFELIVLNDGSTDHVERVLDRYVGHPKVRLLTQINQKLPKALSNAFDFVRGEFWTWTSADNLMEPEQLEKQVAFLREHADTAMVYADYWAIDDRGELLRDLSFRPHNRRTPDSPEIRVPRDTQALNVRQDNFIGACFMYRGSVGRLLGDYLPIMGVEDYDYWMRINGPFLIKHLGTDDLLYRYRVHDNSLNARADVHHIQDHVLQLMEYEKDRAAYSLQPWLILTDAATESWLSDVAEAPHAVRRLELSSALSTMTGKVLLLVHADTLPQLRRSMLPGNCLVAAWFDDDRRAPFRYATDIRTVADICCTANQDVAASIGLFTRNVFRVARGQDLFQLVLAFANNRAFLTSTQPASDWARTLPRVHRHPHSRIRVLFQVENFAQGGLEQVILDIISVLEPARFDVSLLVLGEEGPSAEKARERGIPIVRLPGHSRESEYRQLLVEKRIDVINAHYSIFGTATAHELGIPFVQTVHNSYVWFAEHERSEYRNADPHTTGYICVSDTAAAYACDRLGLSAGKMLIVTNGIDVQSMDKAGSLVDRAGGRAALGYGADDFVLLSTASITELKAQLHLVRAIAFALEKNPRIRIMLLGRPLDAGGGYARRVRDEVERLGIQHAVQFLGYHPDPQKFYYLADGFVLPSFVEGWSLALAEALHAGLPVIASDVGSARALLAQTGGQLLQFPRGLLLDMDGEKLYRFLEEDLPAYVLEIADALVRLADDPRPPAVSDSLRRSFDREVAFAKYARIFEWLALGGAMGGVQAWCMEQPSDACSDAALPHHLPPGNGQCSHRSVAAGAAAASRAV